MFGRYALGSGIALATAIGMGAACGGPEDPFTSGSASAMVTGVVTDSGGTPISGTTVHIACAGGGTPVNTSTDSMGHYLAHLETGSDPFDGGSGRLLCHLTEPAVPASRVQVDTSLGFVRGPVFLALQFVDLHES